MSTAPQQEGTDDESHQRLADRPMKIGAICAELPVLDPRSPDEIIGHDEFGVPR